MRDIDFSPDGDFFVVSTTGAYGGSEAACDTAARFETAQTGTNIAPSWVDYTGGDTSYAVEVTDSVVYIGGHQRWWNNPFRGDAAGAGAVSREGIAALDPVNGLPLSWNPTRTKGVGVFDFLLTGQGLWVASDTDRIGAYQLKSRIARMLPGGTTFAPIRTTVLPNDVYSVAARTSPVVASTASSDPSRACPAAASTGTPCAAPSCSTAGSTWPSPTARSPAAPSTGAPSAHRSASPPTTRSWRSPTGAPTSRTPPRCSTTAAGSTSRVTGSNQLFYRYFTAESDVVGAKRLVASGNVAGIDFAQARGAFVTDSHLYWSTPDGTLRRIMWHQTPQAGGPGRRHGQRRVRHRHRRRELGGRSRALPLPGPGRRGCGRRSTGRRSPPSR